MKQPDQPAPTWPEWMEFRSGGRRYLATTWDRKTAFLSPDDEGGEVNWVVLFPWGERWRGEEDDLDQAKRAVADAMNVPPELRGVGTDAT